MLLSGCEATQRIYSDRLLARSRRTERLSPSGLHPKPMISSAIAMMTRRAAGRAPRPFP